MTSLSHLTAEELAEFLEREAQERAAHNFPNHAGRLRECAARLRGKVAEGWVMVPMEPSEGMMREAGDAYIGAALDSITPSDVSHSLWPLLAFWRAMLAATTAQGADNRKE